jgi:tetratricopeptide (TPR) repeat protein
MSPNDVVAIKQLMSTLAQLGRTQEALDTARAGEVYARRDPEFMNLWLVLEASAGNTQFARERREAILAQSPDDAANKAALAGIYIDLRLWDKARTLLDDLQKSNPLSMQVAALDGRWHAERGDLAGAQKLFKDQIEGVRAKTDPMVPAPYLNYAQFLLRYGMVSDAIATIQEAEKYQDPKTMPVTLGLAQTQFGYGMYPDAEATYRRILSAGVPDPQNRIRRSLIDALIQDQRFDEAEKELAAIGGDADADVELMVLRAEVARGLGDRGRAADLLNRAIARFPDEPLPFYKRARLVMSDPTLRADAMADLATAIKLRPGLWQALRTRYGLLMQQGKVSDALRDLRAAVDANPSMDNLRFELIEQLLANKMDDEAAVVAELALKGRTTDTRLLAQLGERFGRAGYHARAARYYKQLFDLGNDPAFATLYVGSLMAATPPNLGEAEAVLATPGLTVSKSSALLMARAMLRMKQNRESDARADIADALALSKPADLERWYQRFRLIYTDPTKAAGILATQRVQGALADWLAFYRAQCLLEDAKSKPQALQMLAEMGDRPTTESGLRMQVYRLLSVALQSENPDGALKACKDGLALAADDFMLNNNAAMVLSTKLDKAAEALEYAQKAAAAAPRQPAVLDTLAEVQWRLGQKDQAIRTESEALRMPQSEADKVPAALKLARWKLGAGDLKGAGVMAEYVSGLLCDNPTVIQTYKPQLDQFNKDLQSAPR